VPAIHLLISALCMRVHVLFYYFSLLTFPIFSSLFSSYLYLSLTFQNMDPLRFQAGGRRRRPNLGLVCLG